MFAVLEEAWGVKPARDGRGDAPAPAAREVTGTAAGEADLAAYEKTIKPLLGARCQACHGALKQESGLRVDTAAALRAGGDSGPALVPGDAAVSLILARVSDPDPATRMPPEGEAEPLGSAEVAALAAWIDAGAHGPADEQPEPDPRQHWAFQPRLRPELPAVSLPAWRGRVRNPIDAFLAHDHERHGLLPQPEAPRHVLVRRLYLDLVGLPPAAEDMSALLADDAPDWYERLVDRLLADPRHGERWGRHWMDIWRYSDWWGLGDDHRNSQKHIWHFRDWIVESLNADVPYDEMLRQMLAADELYPDDPSRLRATGFLARNWFSWNRTQWLDETVEHVGKGLLGLTLNCSKCHDHKYDPIRQQDFYAMRAFFEPHQTHLAAARRSLADTRQALEQAAPADVAARQASVDVAAAELLAVERRAEAAHAAWAAEDDPAAAHAARAAECAVAAVRAERAVAVAKARQSLAAVERKHAQPAAGTPGDGKELQAARDALAKAEQAAAEPDGLFTPFVGATWSATHFRGSTGKDPAPSFLATSTGRRRALASWITDPRNPLTARVAVNHLWMRHMGRPLVTTTFDFGRKGNAPANPALLDWLACELVEGGPGESPWGMKHLHRLIVTSAAYRMTSSTRDAGENVRIDPDNRLLWRRDAIRLEAEVIRDCMLALADAKKAGASEAKPVKGSEDEEKAAVKTGGEALDAWRQLGRDGVPAADDPARALVAWALLNHNDFVTVR
ncbi:MAG: DUF1549 domain-containing protein [Planctomycetia bacterium]|nr:DUF1549 domain-containing protein [Planctomycetia bacterium]